MGTIFAKAASDLVMDLIPADALTRSHFGEEFGMSFSFASVVADVPMDALNTEFLGTELWDAPTD